MYNTTFSPQDLGITEQDWQQMPPAVRAVVQSIGPLQAEIAKLKEQMNRQYRLSKRLVSRLLSGVLGVKMSASSAVNRQKEMADGLQNAYEEVAASIKTAARRNIDETGWREAGKRSQLWDVTSEAATLFRIVASRASTVPKTCSARIVTASRPRIAGRRIIFCAASVIRPAAPLQAAGITR